MNDRRNRTRVKNRTVAYIFAGLVHGAIIVAVLVNFTSEREVIHAADADKISTIAARAVDEKQVQDQLNKIKKLERDKKLKEQRDLDRLRKLKQQRELEQKRIVDLKKENKEKKAENNKLEEQRKVIALKKAQEEAKRKKDAEVERKRQTKIAADKLRRKQDERAEAEQRLRDQIAAEEAFFAEQQAMERTTTLLQKHMAMIIAKVESVRRVAPHFEIWRQTDVAIKVSPSGVVESVRTIKSSNSREYDEAVETAVYQASPLPLPDQNAEPDANSEFVKGFELEFKHPSARQ
jgi:colicin import membrane protein